MAYQKNILILLFFYTVIKELCLIKFQIITLLCITNLSINKQKLCLNYLLVFFNYLLLPRLVRPVRGLSKPLRTGMPALTLFLKAKK